MLLAAYRKRCILGGLRQQPRIRLPDPSTAPASCTRTCTKPSCGDIVAQDVQYFACNSTYLEVSSR
jgi:hypothetical protein